jgi:hypothetical protein
MGWCTTHDLDRFLTVAGGYLTARAAENTLLLSAAQTARVMSATQQPREIKDGRLFGWWVWGCSGCRCFWSGGWFEARAVGVVGAARW